MAMQPPISAETLFRRCREAAAMDADLAADPESLIGLFQTFRPDGRGLIGVFDEVPGGDELHQRLEQLFAAAGDDRRPEGGRDAYFVIRQPPPIQPAEAERLAIRWLENVRWLALETGDTETAAVLDPLPAVRVLEGLPPKHPKKDEEKADLLKTLQRSVPKLVDRIEPASEHVQLLQSAYYFVCCDAMLRDYLMWPLHAHRLGSQTRSDAPTDPFAPYFELWRHGIKYRIFREDQVDVYLPRL